ncbi:unnamed protein product [Anisakis simplex]|uniref:Tetracycline-efflux transporter, putative (inferred by orthology to a S. mansoni protein) n=1 Tax=Anisakis simplex TaxID=6269 RepID=A0A0M3J7S2_ANISI|nr:unnamed protein product [Anisakis simplex]
MRELLYYFFKITELNQIKAYGRAYFVYLFIYSGLEFTLSFFTHLRFQYDSMQQGRMYLIAGIIMMLLQGGFVRRIAASHHHNAVLIAISILIPAFVCIAFAYTQHLFYCGLVLFAIASAIVIPCMTSCVTNLSSTSARGATIGVFRCIGALARAIGPLFASTVFWIGGPSICYVLGGCALIVPMLMIKRVKHAKTS